MRNKSRLLTSTVIPLALAVGAGMAVATVSGTIMTKPAFAACAPCNPCAANNPCAAKNPCNPCAAKNPCAAANPCNPCAVKKVVANPCNPCNPCAASK